jgi:hypothetical protein
MSPDETPLEMAQRHVREGDAHVASQRRILAELRRDGHPTEMAQTLLAEFESSAAEHREGLARMLEERRAGRRDAQGHLVSPQLPPSSLRGR